MNDLDKLKSLLFGDEKNALESITQRVERPETRAVDVADILPEAIYQSHKNGDHLAVSLRAPVSDCLEQAIHEDPQKYGDALYPVMGPAIRRSIMETLRAFAQQINEAVEQSLTPQGLKWRIQAWRAGIPFGDFLLQKTLLYRVEQAYLISRENGLLVAHVHHEAAKIKDSDAVSAMFTAIQDFVKESFSPDRTGRLEAADMGEFTLWAVHGPHALLVCVIRGVPPKALRGNLSGILERVHFRYGDAIRTYSGDTSSVQGVEDELDACLRFEAKQETKTQKRRISLPLLIVLLLIGTAIGYGAITMWRQSQRVSALTEALEGTPGIYVTGVVADGARLTVRGMRDPLAATVQTVAESIGLPPKNVFADMQAFQSLAPEVVALRAAKVFGQPGGVEFSVSGSTLVISGPAPIAWRQEVRSGIGALSGAAGVHYQTTVDDRILVLRDFLSPPGETQITGDVDRIVLSGSAPAAWIEKTNEQIAALDVPWRIDTEGLVSVERLRLAADVEQLSGRNFFFTDGTLLAEGRGSELPEFVERLAMLRDRANSQQMAVRVTLTGFTDSVGDTTINEQLAARRTQAVASVLVQSGHDPDAIDQLQITADDEDLSVVDFNLRRVSTELSLATIPAE